MSLQQRAEAVRELLVGEFRGAARLDAAKLLAATDKLVRALPEDERGPFTAWRVGVARLEQLEDDQRVVEVARGLRLCRGLLGAPAPPRRVRLDDGSPLTAALESLPGIGPAAAKALAERGILCVGDLLYFVPRRYDDARAAVSLADVSVKDVGERVTIAAEVSSVAYVRRGRRRWVDVRFREGDNGLIVRFFGAYPSAKERYAVGTPVTLAATLGSRGGSFEMTNPDVLAIGAGDGEPTEAQILPRYRAVPKVAAKRLAGACATAVERAAGSLLDAVPESVRADLGLPTLATSIRNLHQPGADVPLAALNDGHTEWHRRLAFEDMFVLAARIGQRRASRQVDEAIICPPTSDTLAAARESLPFTLTGAQERATADIASSLSQAAPMNRLLQGDVGCGKTAVAYLAAAQVVGAGAQVALMAPTEILAEQHAAGISGWAEKAGMRLALFTGSLPAAQRRSQLALLAAGRIDIAIGTHALIAESVEFHRLGLAIVDEQHRFGVAQRVKLRRKGAAPHLLVMTATPIPRSLALSVYGDLDVSTIDELPPGRVPTDTHVLAGQKGRVSAYKALARRLVAGEQAYVVCPLVEPSEDDVGDGGWKSATAVHAELSRALAPHAVGLVHGRMRADERGAAMDSFRRGDDRVLVATTVIEVGVDVPAATVIVIEDADHFGLAQLHQLRGRVGRGGGAGNCALLHSGRMTDDARRRLDVMAETTDGFRIAEEDLAIRGPGELLGARQAGLPMMRFGDLRQHVDLLVLAREHAARVLADDPQLEHPDHQGLVAALRRADEDPEAYDAEGG